MISYIIGKAVALEDYNLIVENNNIGYNIKIPVNMNSGFSIGEQVKIFTYLYVREDAINLYGFFNRDDLMLFKLLIGVSGIGPKGALSILSVMSGNELRLAVASGDSKSISKAPGLGGKTAQRVIIDLKDKLNFETDTLADSKSEIGNKASGAKTDAIMALVSLGYSDSESYKVVNQLDIDENVTAEEIIKLALKKMAF